MSGETAICVEGLGKRYNLGQMGNLTRNFRETLVSMPRFLGNRAKRILTPRPDHSGAVSSGSPDSFWALRDINFEVKHGESVGIIGRNGAGKSTLLKILSRITHPTEGRAVMRGRLSSLLEVGTGFHPELTGRENIYLNGAILGMHKIEIDRKFDEIVDFAEVEKFLDTPVKRYSSGMQVRLAFSVAAHLEPEILIVDEVLAVGDAQFQKKCLGKMDSVSREGRTVLFVSHNMQAVKRLCTRGILLSDGQIESIGTAEEIVTGYLDTCQGQNPNADIPPEAHRTFPPDLEVHRVELCNQSGELTGQVLVGEEYSLRLHYRLHASNRPCFISVSYFTMDGITLASTSSIDAIDSVSGTSGDTGCLSLSMVNSFSPGQYNLEIKVKSGQELIDLISGIPFGVAPVSASTSHARIMGGLVQIEPQWSQSND